jgi:hypothetical protein
VFAMKLNDTYNPPNDLLWVHDYELLLMPSYAVHHNVSPANMGFFLHTPFPSSEVRTLDAAGVLFFSARFLWPLLFHIGTRAPRGLWWMRCFLLLAS